MRANVEHDESMCTTKGGCATYLEVLSDLTNETLEGELADEQLGGLLVATDFTESNGTRPEPVGLLHTTSGSLSWL